MEIPNKDVEIMQKLNREGKPIAEIQKEDFPQYSYRDIHRCVGIGTTPCGIKGMITSKLDTLTNIRGVDGRKVIIQEIRGLVDDIYERHRENYKKLKKIRKVL